jgi:hypothetical protein
MTKRLAVGMAILNVLIGAAVFLGVWQWAGLWWLDTAGVISDLDRAGVIDHQRLQEYGGGRFGEDPMNVADHIAGRAFSKSIHAAVAVSGWLLVNACGFVFVARKGRAVDSTAQPPCAENCGHENWP